MSRKIITTFLALMACMLVTSCDPGAIPEQDVHEEVETNTPTNRVDIPSTVRNNLGITFAAVERRNVANTVRVPGSFELTPLARNEYHLMLPGRVEFEVDQFQQVEAGDLLYRFRSPKWREYQSRIDLAKADLSQSQAKFDAIQARIAALAEAAFKRADLETQIEELRADVARSKAELETALTEAARVLNIHLPSNATQHTTPDKLLSETEREGESLPLYRAIDWIEVHASRAGIVESLDVTDGAFVEETTLLLTTVDPKQIRFRAMGLQSDLAIFEKATNSRIVPPQKSGADINEAVDAELTMGLSADPASRTVTLFATPEKLLPWCRAGVSAFLEVDSDSSGGIVLAIPRAAVVKDGITHVFFKRDPKDPNKAIRVEADLGVDDGKWVEIKSELGPKDSVVLDGAYELKLATSMSGATQKGGHFHADGTFHAEDH